MKRKIIGIIILVVSIFLIIFFNNNSYATEEDITDKFIDENLRNEILELAKEATGEENKTKIYASDIDKIVSEPGGSSLRLAGKGIKDLSGIEVFSDKGITWIFLDWNELTDLSILSSFTSLEKISFSGNNVSNISVLGQLENLENITAINNKIVNIDVLKNLDIKYICLDGNNIKDINVISDWNNLREMSFSNNQIENIPDLSNLSELEEINLSNNKIKSITGNSNSLEELSIDNNELTTLSGIENFTSLKILSCSNNQINSLSGLENLLELENLNINKNQINDISTLVNCSNLNYLYMDNNYIIDFELLSNLENIKKYSAYNQTISIEIKEKIVGEKVEIPLPDLYRALYDKNTFIYKEGLKTEVVGGFEYEISQNNETIILKSEDLKNNQITVQVSDDTNAILKYNINIDKIAPTVEGVEAGKIYDVAVIPTSQDNDIKTVELYKNGTQIDYELGNKIEEAGKYILIIKDYAENETKIEFEIRYELEPEGEEYILDGQYIVGVETNTTMEIFNEKLNGNVGYTIYRENNELEEGSIIATGDKLVTEYGVTFYVIVKGDITKDGVTNIKDLVKIRRNILGIEEFDDLQKRAANLAEDDVINVKDLVMIRKIILGQEI